MVDIASIASFLLPTLLSMLSGEGNEEKFFPLPKKSSETMYGYGYRYPRVPRKVEALYADPEYRFRWVRAAVGNRAVAAKSPWIAHLKQAQVYDKIRDLLRKEAVKYRIKQGGLKPSTKKSIAQRIVKLERAIEALKDQALLNRVASDLGNKYDKGYVDTSLKRLQDELANLQATLEWEPPAEEVGEEEQVLVQAQPQQKSKKSTTKKQGTALLSGLGYGYGYFY
jgi:hypothetical protein